MIETNNERVKRNIKSYNIQNIQPACYTRWDCRFIMIPAMLSKLLLGDMKFLISNILNLQWVGIRCCVVDDWSIICVNEMYLNIKTEPATLTKCYKMNKKKCRLTDLKTMVKHTDGDQISTTTNSVIQLGLQMLSTKQWIVIVMWRQNKKIQETKWKKKNSNDLSWWLSHI